MVGLLSVRLNNDSQFLYCDSNKSFEVPHVVYLHPTGDDGIDSSLYFLIVVIIARGAAGSEGLH